MNSTLVATPPPPPRCESPLCAGPAYRSAPSPIQIGTERTGHKDVCAERGRATRRPAPSGSLRLRLAETKRVTQHPSMHPSIPLHSRLFVATRNSPLMFIHPKHHHAVNIKVHYASLGAFLLLWERRVMKPKRDHMCASDHPPSRRF